MRPHAIVHLVLRLPLHSGRRSRGLEYHTSGQTRPGTFQDCHPDPVGRWHARCENLIVRVSHTFGDTSHHLFGPLPDASKDRYPEMLKRVLVIRAPWVFPAVWRIVRTFLDKGTAETWPK